MDYLKAIPLCLIYFCLYTDSVPAIPPCNSFITNFSSLLYFSKKVQPYYKYYLWKIFSSSNFLKEMFTLSVPLTLLPFFYTLCLTLLSLHCNHVNVTNDFTLLGLSAAKSNWSPGPPRNTYVHFVFKTPYSGLLLLIWLFNLSLICYISLFHLISFQGSVPNLSIRSFSLSIFSLLLISSCLKPAHTTYMMTICKYVSLAQNFVLNFRLIYTNF